MWDYGSKSDQGRSSRNSLYSYILLPGDTMELVITGIFVSIILICIHLIYRDILDKDSGIFAPSWSKITLFVALFTVTFLWPVLKDTTGLSFLHELFVVVFTAVNYLWPWPQPEAGVRILPFLVGYFLTQIYLYFLASLIVWLGNKVRPIRRIRATSN